MAAGSWLVIEELLERGDPAFVDELRACEDAERLAAFAASWHADRRPASRRFLFEYLKRPLNAFHHEGLVKRLFKLAEKAGDDEVMAHFLVLLDRSMRRRLKSSSHFVNESFSSRAAAEQRQRQWQAAGAEETGLSGSGSKFHAWARWPEDRLGMPQGTTMPRSMDDVKRLFDRGGWMSRKVTSMQPEWRAKLEQRRLFTAHTRHYLRRRAWRFFRNLGKTAPDRYVPAALVALKLYEDADVADGVALLDNWGLIHILFHESPALWPRSHGWTLRSGHALGDLTPAPAFPDLWRQAPGAIIELLRSAQCRPVRQWALFFMRKNPALLDSADVDLLLDMLQSTDGDVVAVAARALERRPGLERVAPERWLRLLETAPPTALDAVCSLVRARLQPTTLSVEQDVRLACQRPVPVARLGFEWLQQRPLGEQDLPLLLRLTESEAEALRPEMVRWARSKLARAASFQPAWVLEYLDSRHDAVRAEGWAWLAEEPRAGDEVKLWQSLFESPYDDIRMKLIAHLENRYARRTPALPRQVPLDAEHVRLLWATVLLNIHRGSRVKPVVVGQIVRRLTERSEDAAHLVPILKVALRSIRGPEWRAGLAGVVQLVERQPHLATLMHELIPELQLA